MTKRCPRCKEELNQVPTNSQMSVLICVNPCCPIKRQPQSYVLCDNCQLFAKKLTPAEKGQRERREAVVRDGISQRIISDGRHFRFKKKEKYQYDNIERVLRSLS